MLALRLGDLTRADPVSVDPLSYGIDWEGPVPDIEGGDEVIVDDIPTILSSRAYHELKETLDPLEEDNQYGVRIYQTVADFVASHL